MTEPPDSKQLVKTARRDRSEAQVPAVANRLALLHAVTEPVTQGGPEDDDPLDLIGHLNELREQRISALEEVLASRWPRRWLLSLRLRRCLRQSVHSYRWAGESWHNRRATWMTDRSLAANDLPYSR